MSKLVSGVGLNDAGYQVVRKADNWVCPFYQRWKTMLKRCYGKEYRPSYDGCTVCPEWLKFSNFKRWMESQDWEGKELDKDLLSDGCKVYSPATCLFVSKQVNLFMTDRASKRGLYPLGVTRCPQTGRYKAQVKELGSKFQKQLGRFDTPEEAHRVYWARKCQLARELAACQTNEAVANRLLEIYKDYD